MPRREADILALNNTAGQALSSQRRKLPTNTKSAACRTAAMKLNDHKAHRRQTTQVRPRGKSEVRFRSLGIPAKQIGLSGERVGETLSESRMWRACCCFQCVPICHGDVKWFMLFQSPELNAATRIAWFLPQRLRNIFIIANKGVFASYKMGLSQFSRICTAITMDGLYHQHMYRAAWVMRLHNQPVDIYDGALFPRTIFGGIAQFLDFDEINIVSITHTFMRCYIKSDMNQLRCLKVRDFSDMSIMFCVMQRAVRIYCHSYIPVVVGNGINITDKCKYSDTILTLLAGMDRVYKCDIECKFDTYRQSHEGRYRIILQKVFTQYFENIIPFDVDLVSDVVHPAGQAENVGDDIIVTLVIDLSMGA